MDDILKLINLTNAMYESIFCIVNIDRVGSHRYQESKQRLNAAAEDLIDHLQGKKEKKR